MIGIIKTNDLRNEYLKNFFEEESYIYSENLNDFYNIKTLIISPLGIECDYYFKNSSICLLDIYANNPGITKIICLKSDKKLKEFCMDNNIELIELMEDENFVNKNAILTSEGLMKVIFSDIDKSLNDLNILVLGYGYCGFSLVKHLKAFNKNITVYSNDLSELKCIYMEGFAKMSRINDLNEYDLIINTVPCNIVDDESLKTIKIDAFLYDIASYPYGFDLVATKQLGLKVNVIPGIPGKILPKSAALLMFENIKDYIC